MNMFDSIWFDGREVRLKYDEASRNAVTSSVFKCKEPPTPAFRAAIAAFTGFAISTCDLPTEWSTDCDVRQIKLKEEKKGVRGIVVTIMRKCKNAKNRPVTINTPYMSQRPGNTEGGEELGGWLTEVTLNMMAEIESQAKKYHDGERGEQIPMEIDDTNAKKFSERAAAAETGSTRKARRGAKDTGELVNMDDTIRQALLKVGRDVEVDTIAKWTKEERAEAMDWAEAKAKQLAGNLGDGAKPLKEPKIVKASATLPLQ